MKLFGGLAILLGIICYVINVLLIQYYIDKKAPGLLDLDISLPPLNANEEYLWEKTAGTGIVPKWVSVIGLISIPLIIGGILLVIITLI